MDSDGQQLAAEFWDLWALREQADLVVGVRRGPQRGRPPRRGERRRAVGEPARRRRPPARRERAVQADPARGVGGPRPRHPGQAGGAVAADRGGRIGARLAGGRGGDQPPAAPARHLDRGRARAGAAHGGRAARAGRVPARGSARGRRCERPGHHARRDLRGVRRRRPAPASARGRGGGRRGPDPDDRPLRRGARRLPALLELRSPAARGDAVGRPRRHGLGRLRARGGRTARHRASGPGTDRAPRARTACSTTAAGSASWPPRRLRGAGTSLGSSRAAGRPSGRGRAASRWWRSRRARSTPSSWAT